MPAFIPPPGYQQAQPGMPPVAGGMKPPMMPPGAVPGTMPPMSGGQMPMPPQQPMGAQQQQPPPRMPGGQMPMGGQPMPPPPPPMLHDVTVVRKRTKGQCKIAAVPPEEFGISRRTHTIQIQEAPYLFHGKLTSERDLLEMGFDPDQVENLPMDNELVQGTEPLIRDTVKESSEGLSIGMNPPNRYHKVIEHYCWLNYEEDGKARRYKVFTGGSTGSSQILKRKDGKLAIEEIDQWPFAALTPIIQTHRFFGRSIADIIIDIQQIKTALLRGVLDNTYMSNNQRLEVAESHVVDATLDDVLSNRPGGIVRTKMPGGINPIPNQPLSQEIFSMIGYMDQTRESRTGVGRQGHALGSESLQKINIGQDALLEMSAQSEAREKLVARIFAETGVKDLFLLIHSIVRQNATAEDTVKLRGKWVTVNPRDWKERKDMTVSVGLGTGNKPQQLAFWGQVLALQEKAIQNPALGLCKPPNIHATLTKFMNLGGVKDVDSYFTDPSQPGNMPPPGSQPPDPKTQAAMAAAQAKAQVATQATQGKLQLQQQSDQQKLQMNYMKLQQENAFQLKKLELEHEREMARIEMEAQLKGIEVGTRAKTDIATAVIDHHAKMSMPDVRIPMRPPVV